MAQKILEEFGYPYLSVGLLKMGLIRSRQTELTAADSDLLTNYLWSIVKEIIKTALENRQHLIFENPNCQIKLDFSCNSEKLRKTWYGVYLNLT